MKMAFFKKSVFIFAALSVFAFNSAHAANLFLTADNQQPAVGGTVNVNVRISSSDQTVNAAQGVLYYPKDILEVSQIIRTDSIFDIWLSQPTVNTSTGEISFLGGGTNAFSGTSLQVFTVSFKVRGTGSGVIGFRSSEVTAGDGTGANILASSTGITIAAGGAPLKAPVVVPQVQPVTQITRPATPAAKLPAMPDVTVPFYPDPSKWYGASGVFLAKWNLPPDITDVATDLSKDPQAAPQKSEGLFSNKTFAPIDNGIWYLHVRFKNNVGWGPTAHYRIAIDTLPPSSLVVSMKEGNTTSVTTPTLQFKADDTISGIDFYEIKIDGSLEGQTTSTSLTLNALYPGGHDADVRAFDAAGNSVESRLHFTINRVPYITIGGLQIGVDSIIVALILALILGFGGGIAFYKRRQEKLALRVAFSQDEMNKVFRLIEGDIEELKRAINPEDGSRSQFIFNKLKENISRMQGYLQKGLEKIKK
ncbi:MAG TPA: cohesin domain-containing protein [Candidatus Paceibacterota bacterium]|nr:cohesin domain-containing protein [Candidatus Paceibacterota bacterium]